MTGRLLDELARFLVRGEQTLDFRAHGRILAARCVQKLRTLGRIALERRMEELLDARPLIHHWDRNSAYNHAFASVHSRPTVAGDMFITSAVSSIVSPPKNRNSTTRLC